MQKEKVQEFQTRIVNAGRGELLILNYEILIAQLEDALHCLQQEEEDEFSRAMINAHKLLRELSGGLDFSYDISKELMSIYIYVNKKFIDASIHKSEEAVKEAIKILDVLLSGWKLVDATEDAPIIGNGQKVYAGLTYGKNKLNETTDTSYQRGFKA